MVSAQLLRIDQLLNVTIGPAQDLTRSKHPTGLVNRQVGLPHVQSGCANDGSDVGMVIHDQRHARLRAEFL